MMNIPTLDQANLSGKRVLLRAGFDVPIENGKVLDTTRIEVILPTMKYILDAGASLIIMAHQARPNAERVPAMSQKPVVPVLEKFLGVPVQFADPCVGEEATRLAKALKPGEVLLLENLRYEPGEKSKDESERDAFGKELASLADFYVNDAFTNCHRAHASMTSVPKYLPGCIGLNVGQQIAGLSKAIESPASPVVLIVSGAKTETKVPVIEQFLEHGQDILVGGCIANTLLAAKGFGIGKSRYDEDFVDPAKEIIAEGESESNARIHIPTDVLVAREPSEDAETQTVSVDLIPDDCAIFDLGEETVAHYKEIIANAGTILWNGPLGMYEIDAFSKATRQIADAVCSATKKGVVTVIGGGDTLDFHDRYDYSLDCYTFVSTAGGAMLDFISGKKLPALEALK